MLQYVAMRCSVSQCVAVWCSVLQCGAVCCSVSQCVAVCRSVFMCADTICEHAMQTLNKSTSIKIEKILARTESLIHIFIYTYIHIYMCVYIHTRQVLNEFASISIEDIPARTEILLKQNRYPNTYTFTKAMGYFLFLLWGGYS